MPEPQYVIGVDLGGTHARAGLVSAGGTLLDVQETVLPDPQQPDTALQTVIALTRSLLHKHHDLPVIGIGAGVTGPVDRQAGTVINPFSEPPWQFTPFTQPLHEAFGLPVVLENDADAAALGEYWQGQGRGVERLYVATIGTGIGTSFIEHGMIYRGMDGAHPEGGHMIVDPSRGVRCYCGMTGCWESLASGEAFLRFAHNQTLKKPDWLKTLSIKDIQHLNTPAIMQAARQGNALALQLAEQEGYYLGLGLFNIISLFTPDKIVLCGGLSRYFDLFEPAIRRVIAGHRYMTPAGRVTIQTESLNYYAGVIGAAYALIQSRQINTLIL